ncbi:hypothetical protein EDEG_03742 [Edhazardia aedis USNM 41457]|uniref:Uncharacterized protein n=1 Tax=Edhazardia aedis (strain USNM 41457) TaxID=1003232 RepID=J9DK47_EDHAE|nr:hypothetical protein EDEG_03742 [Edhazardia aedis USNM 41457]|eukprot:EJW01737.1 hypothetical protein EDEG_03742 [Edhazardia aedis USNM 41457]
MFSNFNSSKNSPGSNSSNNNCIMAVIVTTLIIKILINLIIKNVLVLLCFFFYMVISQCYKTAFYIRKPKYDYILNNRIFEVHKSKRFKCKSCDIRSTVEFLMQYTQEIKIGDD